MSFQKENRKIKKPLFFKEKKEINVLEIYFITLIIARTFPFFGSKLKSASNVDKHFRSHENWDLYWKSLPNLFLCEPDPIDFTNHEFHNMANIAVFESLFCKTKYGREVNLTELRLFVLSTTSMASVHSIQAPPKYRQFAPTLSPPTIKLHNRSPHLKFNQGVNVIGLFAVKYFQSFHCKNAAVIGFILPH